MITMKDITEETLPDKVVLVGIGLKPEPLSELKENLAELHELTDAAGGVIVGTLWQHLEKRQTATLIGKGKIEEVREMVEETEADLVILDTHLSGIQQRNLSEHLKTKVIDRSQLILDIFAQRARTYEGKLQVQLAQALDQMPRMVGAWMGSLSKQGGGGIGTRGPGEKAIEIDRRVSREKADLIRKKLDAVRQSRKQHRQARKKNQIPSFALIGYTNSGKSSLLNVLAQGEGNIFVKDQLFATLDPTTKKVYLPAGQTVVMTDTVGFIRKLPHHLIEAFKATLEESAEADILVHVVDISDPQLEKKMETVDLLIKEFKWEDKPILTVFNKSDLIDKEHRLKVEAHPRVFTSAITKSGIDLLKKKLEELLMDLLTEYELFFPKNEEYKIYELDKVCIISKKEASSMGTICKIQINPQVFSPWKKYQT